MCNTNAGHDHRVKPGNGVISHYSLVNTRVDKGLKFKKLSLNITMLFDSKTKGTWVEWTMGLKLGSKAEERVALWLNESGFNFKVQRQFPGLLGVNGQPLRFDFSVWIKGYPEFLLEYQGPYHNCLGVNGTGLVGFEHDKRKQLFSMHTGLPLIFVYIGLPLDVERQVLMGYIAWQQVLFDQRREHAGMTCEDRVSISVDAAMLIQSPRQLEKQRVLDFLREEHDVLVYEIHQLRACIERLRLSKHALILSYSKAQSKSSVNGTISPPRGEIVNSDGAMTTCCRKRRTIGIDIVL